MAFLYSIFWIILAVVMQTLLFNHLQLLGGVVLVYMIALLKMPVEVNRNIQILTGFVCGLIIDIFCNTLGMHTLATVTVMFFRVPILHLFINSEDVKSGVPSNSLMGMSSYIRYAITILAIHCILLYFIEAFTLFNIWTTLLKIVISLLLNTIAIISLEFATIDK